MDPREHIEKLRHLIDEAVTGEHDHHGPDPCPVCGAEPPEPPPARSHHPREERSNP